MELLNEEGYLLTAAQMAQAEADATAPGFTPWEMMQLAGRGVAQYIVQHYEKQPVIVLCGPGNNGGDGYIVAEMLRLEGWPVEVLAVTADMTGPAAKASGHYQGVRYPLAERKVQPRRLVVDALFGTGLTRPLEGVIAERIQEINHQDNHVIAVDMPSGIGTDDGAIMGHVLLASLTLTFASRKLGHVLAPGRAFCGKTIVLDIKLGRQVAAIAEAASPHLLENLPRYWRASFPYPRIADHKYARGAVLVAGGPLECTGAARLAAMGAARLCGAVTIACSFDALPVYAAHPDAVMTRLCEEAGEFRSLAGHKKITALVVGPGHGGGEDTRHTVLTSLASGKALVLDADALTAFESDEEILFGAIEQSASPVVLTPHEGEFTRLFGDRVEEGAPKYKRASQAAILSRAVVVLKGPDTMIADPDGMRVLINGNAPPTLATAGSGDVLAGMIAGLMAGGMTPFDAAAAAVWLHGAAASQFGYGLVASDIPAMLPRAIESL